MEGKFLICHWASLHMPLLASKNYLCWQGVENVYTQHQPLLAQTIESIMRGRLRDIDYPFVGNHFQQGRSVFCADTCPVQPSTSCLFCCRSLTKTSLCCPCNRMMLWLGKKFVFSATSVLHHSVFSEVFVTWVFLTCSTVQSVKHVPLCSNLQCFTLFLASR
jgi:hypothetical protein